MNYDSGLRYDTPNLFWDTPFVPLNTPPPTTKSKKMKRNAYFPSRSADQVIWLENFRNKLPGYQAALGLTVPAVTAAVADARWLVYVCGTWLPAIGAFAPACYDACALAMRGTDTVPQVLPVFAPPAPPAGVVPVVAGALDRIFTMVQTLKESATYTEAIGTDLGVVGALPTVPDLTSVQPVITAKVNAGTVDITWRWGGQGAFLDQCEIQVDRGDAAGWTLLTIDSTPNYTDTTPQPTALARWKYRAIYRVDDRQTGLWSAEASVTVG